MGRWRRAALALGAGSLGILAVRRRLHGEQFARHADGGVLMDDADRYATLSGRLLGGFYASVAADIAASASAGARILELGCGPGQLAIRLVRDHGLEVTALDLDPAMVARARRDAARLGGAQPDFVVGDAAALPFGDEAFDLVVSTLSLHHWTDPATAGGEIARVLRPGGRVLVWDIRPGTVPLHRHAPDPAHALDHPRLLPVATRPWRWPWRVAATQRMELLKAGAPG